MKKPEGPSMLERIGQLWYRKTTEFYTAVKINGHRSTAITWMNRTKGTLSKKRPGHRRTLIPFSRSSGRLAFDCEGYLGRAAKGVDAEERWLSVGAYDVLLFSVTSVRTKL